MGFFTRLVVTTLPLVPKAVVRRVAQRYVAGDSLSTAVEAVQRLNKVGAVATIAVLGEGNTEREKAEAAVEEYRRILEAIGAGGLDAHISIKLSLLGLDIDEAYCLDNLQRVVAAAAEENDCFVRIDMEDHTTTDATLRLYRTVRETHPNLGVALQAYLHRTLQDIACLPAEGANVRLCKGIYIEPRQVAWKSYETVRHNFLACLEKLLVRGVYIGIATHDEFLVCAARAMIDRMGVDPRRYEFQMLLGVDRELRQVLIDQGHRVRIYVPYGEDWYPYSMRRLRENPQIASFVMRAMIAGR
jgi:proline dehydrogenase